MKHLSEAIRKGAEWPDIHGPAFDNPDTPIKCCALGGVILASGIPMDFSDTVSKVCTLYPVALQTVTHPVHKNGYRLWHAIISLYEHSSWSKLAIAEWVETVERKLGLWDEVPKVETAKQETRTEYEVKPREYSFK